MNTMMDDSPPAISPNLYRMGMGFRFLFVKIKIL
jgi:hypothetical protein